MNRALPILFIVISGCASVANRPCTDGGQPAHDDGKKGLGTRQCEQYRDPQGRYLNHGRYLEWYPSSKLYLEGEYSAGQKAGKWIEYSEDGRKLSEKWYENGVLTPGRESPKVEKPKTSEVESSQK